MLTLYIKDNCPYSSAVIHRLKKIGAKANFKNINDNRYGIELIEKGGKFQAPCLVDEDKGLAIYESKDILDYLDNYFPKTP